MPGEYMHFEILVEDKSGKTALDILGKDSGLNLRD
jgi:hypothetical protein